MTGEKGPDKQPELKPTKELAEIIKETAQARDGVTERLFTQMSGGQSAREFVEKACKLLQTEPPKTGEALAPYVHQIQKLLKFPNEDRYDGCDGKLGPYTFDTLIKKFPVLNPKPATEVKDRAREDRRQLVLDANLPKPPVSIEPKREVEREPVDMNQVSYFGDSLTQQYARHVLSKTDFQKYKNKDFKIGKWARTMRRDMERNLDYYANRKAIVIGAGTNDLDGASADKIAGDIEAMYTMLIQKNPNIQIVGLTLLPYPGNAAKNAKINQVNARIKAFAARFPKNVRVVDLHSQFSSAMNSGKKMLYGDKVHMLPKAEKAVARMIQDSLATGTHKDISEYLS